MQEPSIVLKNLGNRVRFLRQRMGCSQEELARKSGLGRSFLSAIELGKSDIGSDTLLKLARSLEVTVGQLMQGTDDLAE